MIKSIIFDIGNVLAAFDWQNSLKAYHFPPEKYEAIANAVYRHDDWNEMDRGVLTVEEVMARFISHAPQYAEDIRRVTEEISQTIYQYPYTKPLLTALKKAGLKTYYLSNYGKFGYDHTQEHLDFIPLMDGGLFSYEVKMIKPNPWIYAELFRRYQIDPSEAIFFDDNAVNVKAAESMGLHAVQFTTLPEALNTLHAYGINISFPESS